MALPGVVVAQAESQSDSTTVGTEPLKASIVHTEVMRPVPHSLRSGESFDLKKAPIKASRKLERFRIPDWLVGTWERKEANETSRIEVKTAKKLKPGGLSVAKVFDTFGSYRDKKGQVWQLFSPQMASGCVDRGSTLDYHNVRSYDLSVINGSSILIKIQAIHTLVAKSNRRIIRTFQDEELNKYTRIADGKLVTDSSVRTFDVQGKPDCETHSVSQEMRVKTGLLQVNR
jgi:hypothetical protein